MADKPRIAVIGSNMIDLVTRVDKMPRMGETIEAPAFDLGFGGKGANQAVAAARLGAGVLMITKVGDDLFGPGYIENFKQQGIDTRYVEVAPGSSNGVAPIFVDADANNSILIVKGANKFLSPKDIDKAADDIRKCGIIILQLEVPVETVYYAVAFGAKNGIPVILNPAPAAPLDFNAIKDAAYLVPNETELEVISGMPVGNVDEARTAAKTLLAKGLANVLVTLGNKGSLWLSQKGDDVHVPPHKVKSIDSTGAGDAFIGSFAYHLLSLDDVRKAMVMANRYAAASTKKAGTQKSFLTAAEFARMA
ncbi:MAG: ribokinase [Planctomycetota bacterium]|jgi:ribokinase|nr:ribokinase [Planctomycetota bacterium]